jgi:hypothetical protein
MNLNIKKHYFDLQHHLMQKYVDIIFTFNLPFFGFIIQNGRIIMERSRPLLEKKYQTKHSIINKQEQLMRLLEN